MRRMLPTRPSPAFVISLIALFVALSGTSYAALNLPKNSVGTKQLQKSAVTGPKIANGAVTSTKIANGVVPTVMWAVINGNGTVARSTPGVTSSEGDTGEYNVVFPRDVTQCVYTATIGQPGDGASQGEIDVASLSADVKGVYVETFTLGIPAPEEKPFHLVVFC